MTKAPLRVVSLLPSATELIHQVLETAKSLAPNGITNAELVGRSHECDWPEEYSNLPMLTASKIKFTSSADVDRQVREQLAAGNGLYSVDKTLLADLKPDVVVTQSLCKVCSVDYCLVEDIAAGMDPKPVLVDTNPTSLEEVLRDLKRVGAAMGLQEAGQVAAENLEKRINAAVEAVNQYKAVQNSGTSAPSIGFCEWTDPIFCGGHWTPQLIEMAGGKHPLNACKPGGGAGPSFTVKGEDFAALNPDIIVVACCGFDIPTTLKEMAPLVSQPWWKDLKAVQQGKVWVVDGNQMFNRPGPRLVDALEWLVSILHNAPEMCPSHFPVVKYEG